jgi:hypothetical protein
MRSGIRSYPPVTRGLLREDFFAKGMDCRVTPGNDAHR